MRTTGLRVSSLLVIIALALALASIANGHADAMVRSRARRVQGDIGRRVSTTRFVISPEGKLRANFTTLWDARGWVVLNDLEVMYKR